MSVQTVAGLVTKERLGVTLTHEHFNLRFEKFYTPPPNQLLPFLAGDITLENVGYVRQYPYSSKTNVDFSGTKVDDGIIEEMKLFKKAGGGTIVENTTHGLQRNLDLMLKASKEAEVNVIAGTGHYVAGVQPLSVLGQSAETLYKTIKSDMEEGCVENPTIKCGVIGEVGSSWPITDFEKKCIMATAQAQQELACGVSFHPGRYHRAPWEILRIYSEAGGQMKKAVMSHLERTLISEEEILEFSSLGSYCQLDLFGTECSFYQLNPEKDMPSDAQRIDLIRALIENGKEDNILISHDIHTKHRLVKFGGHGFSHILNNVVPKMTLKGISKEQIKKITVDNPGEWLCKSV